LRTFRQANGLARYSCCFSHAFRETQFPS
jgi:hypothetical protein